MAEPTGGGCRTPVAFGTRNRWQVEAAVEKLQQDNSRLTWRAWMEGGKSSYGEQLPHDHVITVLNTFALFFTVVHWLNSCSLVSKLIFVLA